MAYTGKFAVIVVIEPGVSVASFATLFNSLMAQKTPNWLLMVGWSGRSETPEPSIQRYLAIQKKQSSEFLYEDTRVYSTPRAATNALVEVALSADFDNYCLVSPRCYLKENFLVTMERRLRSGIGYEAEPRVATCDFSLHSGKQLQHIATLDEIDFICPDSQSRMFRVLLGQNILFKHGVCFNQKAAIAAFPVPSEVSEVSWWIGLCTAVCAGNFYWSAEVLRSHDQATGTGLLQDCLSPSGKVIFPMLRKLSEKIALDGPSSVVALSGDDLENLMRLSEPKSRLFRLVALFKSGIKPHCKTKLWSYYSALSDLAMERPAEQT